MVIQMQVQPMEKCNEKENSSRCNSLLYLSSLCLSFDFPESFSGRKYKG